MVRANRLSPTANPGKSEGDYAEATISMWVDDTVELIKEVVKGPVVLCGSGVGGWVAMHAAQRCDEVFSPTRESFLASQGF